MAETGRRVVVGDPLAPNPMQQPVERDLSTMQVRNPGQTGGDGLFKDQMRVQSAIENLQGAIGEVYKVKQDQWQTEGRIAYMQGQTEQQVAASGNRYTTQGWQSLNAADTASRWYQQELTNIQDRDHSLSPEEYRTQLMQRRAEAMRNMPNDPAVRKVWGAAFDDLGPRLAAQHTAAHNSYNRDRTNTSFRQTLLSTSQTNADASRPSHAGGGSPLALSPGIVRRTVQYNDSDVDTLARTMLGEAAGEGPQGMAAVGHVIMNRVVDGRWGNSVTAVARAPQQFSAWNTGEGGNNPDRFDANSEAYQRARGIAQQVLSGRHVDPTNGATHYYAPGGMRDGPPTWAVQTESESGGHVMLGNHRFSGRARNNVVQGQGSIAAAATPQPAGPSNARPFQGVPEEGSGAPVQPTAQQRGIGAYTGRNAQAQPADGQGGQLVFNNPAHATITDDLRGRLQQTSRALGRNLTIISGNRGEGGSNNNAAVGGAPNSEHNHGGAVDISLVGMNDDQRAQLVQGLRAQGVRRFGIYSGGTALHVDMSDRNGAEWFMFNRSNANMSQAPQWFQQVAASGRPAMATAPQGTQGNIPVQASGRPQDNVQAAAQTGVNTAQTPSGPQTQVQQLLRGSNLPRAQRATALTDAMLIQFQTGSDQLYRDSGGVGMLNELGATTQQIMQVEAARQAHEQRRMNAWSVDNIRWQNNLMQNVSNGNMPLDQALQHLDQRVAERRLSEEQAKTLASQAVAKAEQAGQRYNMSPELMRETTNLFSARSQNLLTSEEADAKLRDIATRHGVPQGQLDGLIGSMWNIERTQDEATRRELQRRAAARVSDNEARARVQSAIAAGEGLGNVNGTITVRDQNGAETTMSAQQWGAQQIFNQLTASARQSIPAALQMGSTREEAESTAIAERDRLYYAQLRKHGIVNEEMRSHFTAAVSGNIIDERTGRVRQSAQQALDLWIRMKNDPNVGSAYMGQYFTNEEGRNLLYHAAETFYAGGVGLDESLRKAHEYLNDPARREQPPYQATQEFSAQVQRRVHNEISRMSNDGWIFRGSVNQTDRDAATQNAGQLTQLVLRQANRYRMMHPGNSQDVNIQKAMDDVVAGTTLVGGNYIYASRDDRDRGRDIAGAMGFRNPGQAGNPLGEDSVNRAVSRYVLRNLESAAEAYRKNGADPQGFGRYWNERRPVDLIERFGGRTQMQAAERQDAEYQFVPPYRATYNSGTGQMMITFYKDHTRREEIPGLMVFNVAPIGKEYRDHLQQRDASPGVFTRMMRAVTRPEVTQYLAPDLSGGAANRPTPRAPNPPPVDTRSPPVVQ